MLEYIGLILILSAIFAIILLKPAKHTCVNCGKKTNAAPCGCRICEDCCKQCYDLKKRCRWMKSEFEGQEDWDG